MVVVAWLE